MWSPNVLETDVTHSSQLQNSSIFTSEKGMKMTDAEWSFDYKKNEIQFSKANIIINIKYNFNIISSWYDKKDWSDCRNCWSSLCCCMLMNTTLRKWQALMYTLEFDTKKLLSSPPEAEMGRAKLNHVILTMLCCINLREWTFN